MINSQTAVPNKRHSRTTDRNRIRRDQSRQAKRLSQQIETTVEATPKQ